MTNASALAEIDDFYPHYVYLVIREGVFDQGVVHVGASIEDATRATEVIAREVESDLYHAFRVEKRLVGEVLLLPKYDNRQGEVLRYQAEVNSSVRTWSEPGIRPARN